MYLLKLLFSAQLAFSTVEVSIQKDIDDAFGLIMQTQIGGAICRDILGANAEAIKFHLGVSMQKAQELAKNCGNSEPSAWIYPTSPADIRKLRTKSTRPRGYHLVKVARSFPIESWTDPYSNQTTILTVSGQLSFTRLVQLLAHETAVYFDSKTYPMHPGAQDIPHLRDLKIESSSKIKPLMVVSDPLIAHTLTYLRALQVEFKILSELVATGALPMPDDLRNDYLKFLVSDQCLHGCIEKLVYEMRPIYHPISLPLLAFASHYRNIALRELSQLHSQWGDYQWSAAKQALDTFPVQFLEQQFTGDVVADLSRVYYANGSEKSMFTAVNQFLDNDLWPLEKEALASSRVGSGMTLLEFLKRPLLSGYNILLSSGPRARIRDGGVE